MGMDAIAEIIGLWSEAACVRGPPRVLEAVLRRAEGREGATRRHAEPGVRPPSGSHSRAALRTRTVFISNALSHHNLNFALVHLGHADIYIYRRRVAGYFYFFRPSRHAF
jgi:hypothetical protein